MKKNKTKNGVKTECAIVIYHSVGNMLKGRYPGAKGLSEENFSGQLDFISKNYAVISLKNYADFLGGSTQIPKKSCVLTFDDGLKNNYLNAFPILRQKKIPACFFPLTLPIVKSVILPVHQTSFLLAEVGAKILTDEFNQILKSDFPDYLDKFFIEGKIKKDKRYKWDAPLTANLKYSISGLPQDIKTKIINRLFSAHFSDAENFFGGLYMNFEEMKEMMAYGMSFGSHGHSHSKLSELGKDEQIKEIKNSKEILEKGLRTEIKLFSYPYGSYNEITMEILADHEYVCAITSDYGINYGKDINVFALKRMDTLDLPFKEN